MVVVDAKRKLTDPVGMKMIRTRTRLKDKGDDGDHLLEDRSGGTPHRRCIGLPSLVTMRGANWKLSLGVFAEHSHGERTGPEQSPNPKVACGPALLRPQSLRQPSSYCTAQYFDPSSLAAKLLVV